MLLIALDQERQFWLTAEKAHDWYGVSVSTANCGYAELERHGLLASRHRRVKHDMSASGVQLRLMRRLIGDFARPARMPVIADLFATDVSLPNKRVARRMRAV